jgi:hypothetical protein
MDAGVLLVSLVASHLDAQMKTDLYKTNEASLTFQIGLHICYHLALINTLFYWSYELIPLLEKRMCYDHGLQNR